MNRTDKFLILILIIGTCILLGIGFIFKIIEAVTYFVTIIPFSIVSYKYIKQNSENQILRKQKLEREINPAIKTLVRLLEHRKESIEIIEGFEKKSKSFFKKDNITETIVLSCFELANILKIDIAYKRGYSLALSYELSYFHSLRDGDSATEIYDSVIKRKTSPFGKNPDLKDNEINWYKKFLESDDLVTKSFDDVFLEIKDLPIPEIDQKQSLTTLNIEDFSKVLEKNNPKIDKLIKLIAKDIPTIDINKILSTLRTEVVIISSRGGAGTTDKSGGIYLKKALDEKLSPNDPKLNNSVRFVLLDQLTKNEKDPLFFDLKKWGNDVVENAREKQDEEGGTGSRFSFVVIQSAIHELYFFGDDLPEKGAIRLPPEIFDGLKPEETTKSTLQVLAKALSKEKLSLRDLIERNLQYLDGIPDKETAKKITLNLEKHCNVQKWTISDFGRPDLKIDYFTEIGITEEHANSIISEAKELSEILSSK